MIRPPDPSSSVPLFSQISDQLRWQVSTGALRPGSPLPATRDAATAWRVHRHTVARAYRELRDAGLVVSGSGGRMIVAVGRSGEADAPGVDSFLRETLDIARAQLGLTPGGLVTALRSHAGAEVGHDHVCAIECTSDQCADLERQIESQWRVAAGSFCLDTPGEPPAVPLVAPLFHFDEIRERWPHRLADTRFVAVSVDPVIRDLVEHVAGGPGRHDLVLLVEADVVAGLALIEELEALLGSRFPTRLETLESRRGAPTLPDADIVIATPSAHAALAEVDRARLDVIRLRYTIDRRDLGALGVVFGWSARPPRVSRVHRP
jgi:DNA-binding transcriptional regulator YhcF (GntR family)